MIAGPIEVTLHVSTTGTDADFVVKLIDVYPGDTPSPEQPSDAPGYPVRMGGYQQLVRGEPFRGKFRNSFEKPEPFVPGQPATIAFTMPDAYHAFRRGHRMMVQVQSSWFPLHRPQPADVCRHHQGHRGGLQETDPPRVPLVFPRLEPHSAGRAVSDRLRVAVALTLTVGLPARAPSRRRGATATTC